MTKLPKYSKKDHILILTYQMTQKVHRIAELNISE